MAKLSRPTLFYVRHIVQLVLWPARFANFNIGTQTFTLRPRTLDGYIINEVYKNADYSPVELSPMLQGGVFVDLGAQIGVFSVWASKQYQPSKLICVEPEAGNRALLAKNLARNNVTATVEPSALWYHARGIHLKLHASNSGGHRTVEDGMVNTETLTLAELLKGLNVVDYLKVDIEGAEVVLFTPENLALIKEKVRFIKMEVHLGYGVSKTEVSEKLASIGFTVIDIPQPFPKRFQTAILEASPATTTTAGKTTTRKSPARPRRAA